MKLQYPMGSMVLDGAGIYANIGGTLMGPMLPYIAYMDPMGTNRGIKDGINIHKPAMTAWVPFGQRVFHS